MPETLKKIGIIIGEREGKIIAKLDSEISFSTKIYDRNGKIIGKISRLFGPVKSPYIAIDGKGSKAEEIYLRWDNGGRREEKGEKGLTGRDNKMSGLRFNSSGERLRERRVGLPGLRTGNRR